MTKLDSIGASLITITQPFIDPRDKSPYSKLIVNIFSILAEFEIDLIRERIKAGLESARRRNAAIGALKGLSDKNKKRARLCAYYFKEGELKVKDICKEVGVSRATYSKYLEHEGLKDTIRPYKKKKTSKKT